MADNPHVTLRGALGITGEWNPGWAKQLKQQHENVFTADPDTIYGSELEELARLHQEGHRVEITAARLNRPRIIITTRTQG